MASKLTAELILEIGKFKKNLKKAKGSVQSSFKGGGSGKSAGAAVGGGIVTGILGTAVAVSAAMVAVVGGAALGAALIASKRIAEGVKKGAEEEKFQMRFEVLSGSRGAGNRLLAELREDSMRTGVELKNMAGSVGKFMALGFNTDEALKLNKGILDVGGSVGLTAQEMNLLGVALTQVKAKGVASMEELRQQIGEKAVPIFEGLQTTLGVDSSELTKMIQEGKVSADIVMDMFMGIADGEGALGQFSGGADKMASTLIGSFDRLKRGWDEFLRVFGNPVVDALKPILDTAIDLMDRLIEEAEGLGVKVAKMTTFAIAFVKILSSMDFDGLSDLFFTAMTFAAKKVRNFLFKVLVGVFQGAVRVLMEGIVNAVTLLSIIAKPEFWSGLTWVFQSIAMKFGETIMNFIADAVDEFPSVMGFLTSKTSEELKAKANGMGADSKEFGKNASEELKPFAEQMENRMKDAYANAGKAFMTGFNETGDIVATGKEEGELGKFFKGVGELGAEMEKERKRITEERNTLIGEEKGKPGGGSGGGSGADGAAVGLGRSALNGAMSQAINTITGRSAYEMVAIEAVKTNEKLDKIEKNTRPPKATTVVPPFTASPGGGGIYT